MKYSSCQNCGVEKTTREQKKSKLCLSCSNLSRYNAAHTETRVCVKCKETKHNTSDYFPYRSLTTQTLKAICKICDNKRRAINYKNNLSREKNTRLKNDFGITLVEYKLMFEKQNGQCAICFKPPKRKNLAVDHCHKSGKIRGLLCGNCNTALGKFSDNQNLLLNAIEYLKNNQ